MTFGRLKALLSKMFMEQDGYTLSEAADLIEKFASNSEELGAWDWENFIAVKHSDERVEDARQEVFSIRQSHPPIGGQGGWCSNRGTQRLKELAKELRRGKLSEGGELDETKRLR